MKVLNRKIMTLVSWSTWFINSAYGVDIGTVEVRFLEDNNLSAPVASTGYLFNKNGRTNYISVNTSSTVLQHISEDRDLCRVVAHEMAHVLQNSVNIHTDHGQDWQEANKSITEFLQEKAHYEEI